MRLFSIRIIYLQDLGPWKAGILPAKTSSFLSSRSFSFRPALIDIMLSFSTFFLTVDFFHRLPIFCSRVTVPVPVPVPVPVQNHIPCNSYQPYLKSPLGRTASRMKAPPGYVIDFAHPQRKGDNIGYWVSGVGLVLSFIFLSMQVYIKAGIARKFNLADSASSPMRRYRFSADCLNSMLCPCMGMDLRWSERIACSFDLLSSFLASPFKLF